MGGDDEVGRGGVEGEESRGRRAGIMVLGWSRAGKKEVGVGRRREGLGVGEKSNAEKKMEEEGMVWWGQI